MNQKHIVKSEVRSMENGADYVLIVLPRMGTPSSNFSIPEITNE